MQDNERSVVDWMAINISINRCKLTEMKITWKRLIVIAIAYSISITVFIWMLSILEERGNDLKNQQEKEYFDQRFKILEYDNY